MVNLFRSEPFGVPLRNASTAVTLASEVQYTACCISFMFMVLVITGAVLCVLEQVATSSGCKSSNVLDWASIEACLASLDVASIINAQNDAISRVTSFSTVTLVWLLSYLNLRRCNIILRYIILMHSFVPVIVPIRAGYRHSLLAAAAPDLVPNC